MANITFKNGEEYALRLSKLAGDELTKVCGHAIYDAAEIVADAIRQELEVPVWYIGVGEGIDDLQPFNAKDFVEALF